MLDKQNRRPSYDAEEILDHLEEIEPDDLPPIDEDNWPLLDEEDLPPVEEDGWPHLETESLECEEEWPEPEDFSEGDDPQ